MKSILPIILIVLALTGAITYSLARRAVPQKPTESIGIAANELEGTTITPTPTTINKVTFNTVAVTPSVTPTATPATKPTVTVPVVTEKDTAKKSAQTKAVATTTKTTVCTPVYGAAETCTEHVVVDTGAESAIFFNLAGVAYLGGLLSFVKAKTLKK